MLVKSRVRSRLFSAVLLGSFDLSVSPWSAKREFAPNFLQKTFLQASVPYT